MPPRLPPIDVELCDLTTIQRTALVMYHIGVRRKRLSTSEVADITGVTDRGALYIMHMISGMHEVPLVFAHGKWYLSEEEPV